MQWFKALVAGLIGGGIAAAIWVAVGWATLQPWAWAALPVGLLAGCGVRFGAGRGLAGLPPGLLAAAISLGLVVLAKCVIAGAVAAASVASVKTNPDQLRASAELALIFDRAAALLRDKEDQDIPVLMPGEARPPDASLQDTCPPEIWSEAKKQWEQLPRDDRERMIADFIQAHRDAKRDHQEALEAAAWWEGFCRDLRASDSLWIGLATFVAVVLGAGIPRRVD